MIVYINTSILDDPRVARVGDLAFLALLQAAFFSSRTLKRGLLTAEMALAVMPGPMINKLVGEGLLLLAEGGYHFCDLIRFDATEPVDDGPNQGGGAS